MTHTFAETSAAIDASDDPDPSSETGNPQRGLFGRLREVFSASDVPEAPANPAKPAPAMPGLASLRRLRVADVAIPKAEIVAVPRVISPHDLMEVFRESGFSRLPVYNETLDKPLGLLLLKDFFLRRGLDAGTEMLELDEYLRPLLFVPPSMPLTVLFQKMQAQRVHMALVIDEYGGVDGLLTIEDLLEEVVGDIGDEHDTDDENLWTAEGEGVWQVQARAMLEDLRLALGFDLAEGIEDDDVDTLGGLVYLLAGRVPARGEVIAHPAGHEIEVLEGDPRRIKRLRIRQSTGTAPETP
ncbi:MAG: transporter associated domain-containing protein [Paracoccaceae bacterium]